MSSDLWISLPPTPVGIHVYSNANGERHPFTPEAVRTTKVGTESGLWQTQTYVGLILTLTERAWRSEDLDRVELEFSRPAKGSGGIAIKACGSSIEWPRMFITSARVFDENLLDWSRQVISAFDKAGIRVLERDNGYDA